MVLLFGRPGEGARLLCCLGGGERRVYVVLMFGRGRGGGCRVFVFAVWAWGGRGRVYDFAVWGEGGRCFCCFGGGAFFWLFGRETLFVFLLLGRGTGVHSLTGLPGLALMDYSTKQQKQNTGSIRRP